MPFPVKSLIQGRSKPVTVTPKTTALEALQEMMRHDYSQLPIVDEQGRPEGLITSDSILRSLSHFQTTINQLHVRDASCTAKTFAPEDDLFELLDGLRDAYAVLIVDNQGALTGIVTDYDTSEYFRRRAEDIMLVEDIERTLRDFILAAFPNTQESDEENLDSQELSTAISKLSSSGQDMGRFRQAVLEYLKLENLSLDASAVSIKAAFDVLTPAPRKSKLFTELTFSEIEDVLFSADRWQNYEKAFTVEKVGIKRLLDDVRETRNKLAHFKGEVTEPERIRLRFCIEWLQRHQNAVFDAFPKPAVAEVIGLQPAAADLPVSELPLSDGTSDIALEPEQEEPQASDSKYAKLALYLRNLPIAVKEQELTFKEIEATIGSELPSFARQHRSWWANDSKSHVQSQEWLDAGWRVASMNIDEERVKFRRILGRDLSHFEFFTGFVEELRTYPDFLVREALPDGQRRHIVRILIEKQLFLVAAFAAHHKFRIELDINSLDVSENKALFDALHLHKDHIEQAFGYSLRWGRFDKARPSRVAYYMEGAITDTPEQLGMLKKEAAQLMVRFLDGLREPISEIMASQ